MIKTGKQILDKIMSNPDWTCEQIEAEIDNAISQALVMGQYIAAKESADIQWQLADKKAAMIKELTGFTGGEIKIKGVIFEKT